MTLDEFKLLDETTQTQMLIEDGVLLAERVYKTFIILLYQVQSFYVEVYHNTKYDVVQGIRSFQDDDTLQPYLDTIDISCLYS